MLDYRYSRNLLVFYSLLLNLCFRVWVLFGVFGVRINYRFVILVGFIVIISVIVVWIGFEVIYFGTGELIQLVSLVIV